MRRTYDELGLHSACLCPTLLDDMRQLMGKQFLPAAAARAELALSKKDIAAGCKSAGIEGAIQLIGAAIGMDPHTLKAGAKTLFHTVAERRIQSMTAAASAANRTGHVAIKRPAICSARIDGLRL